MQVELPKIGLESNYVTDCIIYVTLCFHSAAFNLNEFLENRAKENQLYALMELSIPLDI